MGESSLKAEGLEPSTYGLKGPTAVFSQTPILQALSRLSSVQPTTSVASDLSHLIRL
jgi:hypothetical protein